MTEPHKLYAIAHSLYSGRARSYLIKAGIPFTEISTGHESFISDVVPKATLRTVPTLVTNSGEVIRDGAAIIEHFESSNGRAFQPATARQKVLSALFDLIGTDGLLRPAMHYRWNYLSENEAFLHYHFLHSQRDTPTREEKTRHMMGRMVKAGRLFGVAEDRTELIETLYEELLDRLNEHFKQMPYLFGWRPSIGDFGLIAPLYAHLGRDPAPLKLMQEKAIWLYRWVERMNRPDQDAAEYLAAAQENYLENDDVPDTLINVLALMSEDLLPETAAAAAVINSWLAEHKPESGSQAERFFDMAHFEVRNQQLVSVAQSYRFVMLQQAQDLYDALNQHDQSRVKAVLAQCNLETLLDIRLDRRLGWANNVSVWE